MQYKNTKGGQIAAVRIEGVVSPEVGSEEWCTEMKEKPKQNWTAKEAADYTKYCILGMEKK